MTDPLYPSTELATLPPEVLQDIALDLVPTMSNTAPPLLDLVNFLVTCRYIRGSLHHLTCPTLYADIFRLQFDPPSARLSDAALTHELFLRHRAILTLRRVTASRNRGSVDPNDIYQSLWTAIMMALENCGRNLQHLGTVDVSGLCETILSPSSLHLDRDGEDTKGLVLWLRVLTLNQGVFPKARALGLPFSALVQQVVVSTLTQGSVCPPEAPINTAHGLPRNIIFYSRRQLVLPVNPFLAACLIRFAWEDAGRRPDLDDGPVDREAALFLGATQCATQEDCRALKCCTPFSTCACEELFPSPASVDPALDSILSFFTGVSNACISGLWEGMYMCYDEHPVHGWGFGWRKPMQLNVKNRRDIQSGSVLPANLTNPMERELLESHDALLECPTNETCGSNLDPSKSPLVIGATLPKFSAAWGSYLYVGRQSEIQKTRITLVRRGTPDNDIDSVEELLFGGHVLGGQVLVGTWHSLSQTPFRGIFCMRKVDT
ncbi:hypothetical protein DL96DRAFT_305135 [Flagelloscypha sp. PMI_526]|nr:hypothetical protein DL96DRAFT_305135 [Flagelloscypha sp. PMI_526]